MTLGSGRRNFLKILNDGNEIGSAPGLDEIEVSILGPGKGECVLVHLGQGDWAIVDCFRLSGECAPLAYLKCMGVDPAEQVRYIVATHWHSDHIGGLSELAEACPRAKVAYSNAFYGPAFGTLIELGEKLGDPRLSEVSEFQKLRKVLKDGKRVPAPATAARLLERNVDHNWEIWSLSPSDRAVDAATRTWSQIVPTPGNDPRPLLAQNRQNNASVVVHISCGGRVILLGGDLEESGNPAGEWSAIVGLDTRPGTRAKVFKIPHHGSQNGHCDAVWTEMLENDPIALLAPYSSSRLPTDSDIVRICSQCKRVFIAHPPNRRPVRSLLGAENRRSAGLVRLRSQQSESWEVECFGAAGSLSRHIPSP